MKIQGCVHTAKRGLVISDCAVNAGLWDCDISLKVIGNL